MLSNYMKYNNLKINRVFAYRFSISNNQDQKLLNNKDEPKVLKILKYKYTILYAFSSLGFLSLGYPQFTAISAGFSIYNFYNENKKISLTSHNYIDETFTKTHNNKINYAVE